MKKLVFVFLMGLVFQIQAQNAPKKSQANFELGSGLTFNFNDSSYIFKLGGIVQPYIGIEQASPNKTDYFLNSKRSYFNFQGYASDEKVGFFIQLDYSLTTPYWMHGLATTQFLVFLLWQVKNKILQTTAKCFLWKTNCNLPIEVC